MNRIRSYGQEGSERCNHSNLKRGSTLSVSVHSSQKPDPRTVGETAPFYGLFQMDSEGFIFLHRKLRDHWIATDHPCLAVFLQILLRVEWNDAKTVFFNGAEIKLKPGEMSCGIHQMSRWARLSVRQTRTALYKLKSTRTVTIKASNKFSILYLENWEKYQKIDKQTTSKIANERQTSDKRATTLEEGNKGRSKEKAFPSLKKKYVETPTRNNGNQEQESYPPHVRALVRETIQKLERK